MQGLRRSPWNQRSIPPAGDKEHRGNAAAPRRAARVVSTSVLRFPEMGSGADPPITHHYARAFWLRRRATGADGAAPSRRAPCGWPVVGHPLEVASLRPRELQGPQECHLIPIGLRWRASLRRRRGTNHAPLRLSVLVATMRNRRRRSGALQESTLWVTCCRPPVGGGLAEAATGPSVPPLSSEQASLRPRHGGATSKNWTSERSGPVSAVLPPATTRSEPSASAAAWRAGLKSTLSFWV
jgi:hypothetical protein